MLEANKEKLKKIGLYEVINDCKNGNVEFVNNRLTVKGIELDREENSNEKRNIKSIDTIFLFGFGQGNKIKKIREKFPKTVLVIFEHDPCILKSVLEKKDLSWIFEDPKIIVSIIKDEETLKNNIWSIVKLLERRLEWGDYVYLVTDGYDKIEPGKAKEIKDELFKNILPIITNRSTLIERSKNIVINTIKNTPNVAFGGVIEDFNDKFKGKPSIVVASGPSLSKNIGLLKDVEDRAVIIAVDSVLPVLERENIRADFVCGVDYQEVNMEKYGVLLKKRKKIESIYVAADGVFYSIPKLFKYSFFEYSQLSVTALYLKPDFKKRHFFLNAVTHLAVQLAYILGSNPIIFLGQDWAYSGAKDHADGASIGGALPPNVIWVKGNYEEKVPTNDTLYSGLKLVEDIIRGTKEEGIKYINATEGGAYIEGTEIMAFKEVIDKYLANPLEKGLIYKKPEPKLQEFVKKTREINKRLAEIVRKSSKCIVIDEMLIKKWQKNKNVDEIKKDVDKVNKINDEITYDPVFNSIVNNLFFKEFFHFNREEIDIEGQDTTKRLQQSLKYFKLIKEKTVQAKKHMEMLLNYLELLNEYQTKKKKFLSDINKVVELASLHYEFRDLYTGIEFINEILKLYPDDARLYYWKAKYCTLNRFMHKEALENFEKALELDPNFEKALFDYEVEKKMVQSHMILAKSAAERKDYISAKRLIDRALDYEPENEELKRWKNVIEELATVTKNAQRQNLLLKQLELEGEAFEKYKTAIEFVKKEQMDKAFDILKELYDKYGNFADIPFLLGSIYIDRKEFDKAEKYLKEAVELIPYQPLVYLALGKLYIEKEDYVAAKENLEKAVSMNPDLKPGVLDTLGNLYYEFGEYEKAFRAFEEYLQYSDDKIKTLTKIALCYKEMGMINEYNMLMEKIKSITGAN